jgi:DNA-binding CsgD family transcriptional regulator
LTVRQLQVVALLADGLRAEDIADELNIATTTVYKHVKHAKQRADVNTRDELVALVVDERLIPIEFARHPDVCVDPIAEPATNKPKDAQSSSSGKNDAGGG